MVKNLKFQFTRMAMLISCRHDTKSNLIKSNLLMSLQSCILSSNHYFCFAPRNLFIQFTSMIWWHLAIERFLFEYCKTKTKVITLTNHNSSKQSYEPIRARSKYMSLVPSAGKRVRVNHEWFWFYF